MLRIVLQLDLFNVVIKADSNIFFPFNWTCWGLLVVREMLIMGAYRMISMTFIIVNFLLGNKKPRLVLNMVLLRLHNRSHNRLISMSELIKNIFGSNPRHSLFKSSLVLFDVLISLGFCILLVTYDTKNRLLNHSFVVTHFFSYLALFQSLAIFPPRRHAERLGVILLELMPTTLNTIMRCILLSVLRSQTREVIIRDICVSVCSHCALSVHVDVEVDIYLLRWWFSHPLAHRPHVDQLRRPDGRPTDGMRFDQEIGGWMRICGGWSDRGSGEGRRMKSNFGRVHNDVMKQ